MTRPAHLHSDAFYLRIVRAKRGGTCSVRELESAFASVHSALEVAERLQAEFDADGEFDVRVYVVDDARVPIRRATGREVQRQPQAAVQRIA
jgi:hypothetical protein